MSTEPKEMLGPDAATQLADSNIVTKRGLSRRSFMVATGTLAVAAALSTLVVGTASAATDPDKKKTADTKNDKQTDPDKSKHKKHWWSKKDNSGDQPDKASDPDKKK